MAQAFRQSPQSPLDREGFLCPICLQDLGSSNALAVHFESAHNNEDSPDVLDQVKGFFGKAKKFFTFEDEPVDSIDTSEAPEHRISWRDRASSGVESYFEPQDIGKTRVLTGYFKAMREAKIDRTAIECSKLVIRLSKLTGEDVPEDAHKRKAFEQKVVSWSEDGSVKVCSTCGKSFNLARRRHHCRLCGGIMCDRCSEFLPFTQAKLMSTSVTSTEVNVSQPVFLRRRGSNSSLNSLGSQEAGLTLRTCSKCRKLLELHHSKQEQRHQKAAIVVLYEKLQSCKVKADEIAPEYVKIAFSLGSGETTHSLERAGTLRQQIAKTYNEMESISKRIVSLKGSENEEPNATTAKLQLHIRAYTISYIQDCSATLPTLPDEKQLVELVNQKEEERKRKIEKQLQHAQEISKAQVAMRKAAAPILSAAKEKPRQPVVAAGWKPGEVDTREVQDDDPMIQQINIIRGYLKQAKQAQRHDEVEMLEENLRHLEDEYYRQST